MCFLDDRRYYPLISIDQRNIDLNCDADKLRTGYDRTFNVEWAEGDITCYLPRLMRKAIETFVFGKTRGFK